MPELCIREDDKLRESVAGMIGQIPAERVG